MRPPFRITPEVLTLCAQVERAIGRVEALSGDVPEPRLRRENRIRTVLGTVAIEGNRLDRAQVTAILDHKRVVGPSKDIAEVANANDAYELAPSLRPFSWKDMLRAHALLMRGLVADAGQWRTGNVGILRGTSVKHVAPQPKQVPRLMADLMSSLKRDRGTPLLIRACVAHYEIEFIHPFSDGNGRMGRLWQHVMLLAHSKAFGYLPVESVIQARQARYYRALALSDQAGDSTAFVAFALTAMRDALLDLARMTKPAREDTGARLTSAHAQFAQRAFTRKDYRALHPTLSTATASRDLKQGVDVGALLREGEKALAQYRFRSRYRGARPKT